MSTELDRAYTFSHRPLAEYLCASALFDHAGTRSDRIPDIGRRVWDVKWEVIIRNLVHMSHNHAGLLWEALANVPKELAEVHHTWKSPLHPFRPLIVLVSGSVMNASMRFCEAELIRILVRCGILRLVSAEGADGRIDTSWFRAFPGAEIRKEVAAHFVKEMEITGPEYCQIALNVDFDFFGADDRTLYIKHLNAITTEIGETGGPPLFQAAIPGVFDLTTTRCKVMMTNTLARMRELETQTAILHVGRTFNFVIWEGLESLDVSYMDIEATRQEADDWDLYYKALTNQRQPLEELLMEEGIVKEQEQKPRVETPKDTPDTTSHGESEADVLDQIVSQIRHIAEGLGERPELAASFRQTGDLDSLVTKGFLADARNLAKERLATASGDPGRQLALLHTLAYVSAVLCQWEESEACSRESLRLCETTGDIVGSAMAYNVMGLLAKIKGNMPLAKEDYEKSLKILETTPSSPRALRTMAQVCKNLAFALVQSSDCDRAITLCQKALAAASEIGDFWTTAQVHNNLALAYADKRAARDALASYRDALVAAEEVGDIHCVAHVTHNIAQILQRQERMNDALEFYSYAISFYEQVGDGVYTALTYRSKAYALCALKKPDAAIEAFQQALRVSQEAKDGAGVLIAHGAIAAVLNGKGALDAALLSCEGALATCRGRPDVLEFVDANSIPAFWSPARKDLGASVHKDVPSLKKACPGVEVLFRVYRNLIAVRMAKGDITEALTAAEELLRNVDQNSTEILVEVHRTIAAVCEKAENWDTAIEHLQSALQLAEQLTYDDELKVIRAITKPADIVGRTVDEHVEQYRKTLEARSTVPICVDMAAVYEQKGNIPRALEFYQRTADADDAVHDTALALFAYRSMARIYLLTGDWTKSLEKYRIALQKQPGRDEKDAADPLKIDLETMHDTLTQMRRSAFLDKAGGKESAATILADLAAVLCEVKSPSKARKLYEDALSIRREIQDKKGIAAIWEGMARTHEEEGHWDDVIGCSERARAVYEETGEQDGMARCLDKIGEAHQQHEGWQDALRCHGEALVHYEHSQNAEGMATVCKNLGKAYHGSGDTDRAVIFNRAEDSASVAVSYACVGDLHLAKGEIQCAADWYHRALPLLTANGNSTETVSVYEKLALTESQEGRCEKAREFYEKMLQMSRKAGSRYTEARALAGIASLMSESKQWDGSIEFQRQALSVYEEIGADNDAAATYNSIGFIYQERKDQPDNALECFEKSLAIYETLADPVGQAMLSSNVGEVYQTKGQLEEASKWYDKAIGLAEEARRPGLVAIARGNCGLIKVELEAWEEARECLEESVSVLQGRNGVPNLQRFESALAQVRQHLGSSPAPPEAATE